MIYWKLYLTIICAILTAEPLRLIMALVLAIHNSKKMMRNMQGRPVPIGMVPVRNPQLAQEPSRDPNQVIVP